MVRRRKDMGRCAEIASAVSSSVVALSTTIWLRRLCGLRVGAAVLSAAKELAVHALGDQRPGRLACDGGSAFSG
jgi:hypothetical protein